MPAVETLYERHRDSVLATLGRQFGWLAEDEREEIFHDAYALMLEKQRDGVLDPEAMAPSQIRAYLIRTAINKARDEGKRPRRTRSRPLGDDAMAVPDRGPEPDEVAASSLDGARVREIVSGLPARRQAVVKLRFFLERTPEEIQRMLAISSRVYRHDLERGVRFIAERYALVRAGTYCESREDLIMEYIASGAEAKRAAEARAHLASCPGCARWAVELREAARRVGAAAPLPALAAEEGPRGSVAEAAAALRDAIADGFAGAKQLVIGLLTRADQGVAGYATAVRPGAVAAVVAGCITAGGGITYCAVEGVPGPIRALFSQSSEARAPERPTEERAATDQRRRPPPSSPEPQPLHAQPQPVRPVATKPPQPEQDSQPAPEPADTAPAPRPEPRPSATEFGLNGSGTAPAPAEAAPSASAPAPEPAPEPTSDAESGSNHPPRPGEFDP